MTSKVIPLSFGPFSPPFPWATPAVDSLICTLDARNVGLPEIVRRVKEQFPALTHSAIPMQEVQRRILILDQIIELDYFKHGLGLAGTTVDFGIGRSRAMKHGMAVHENTDEPWEKTGLAVTNSGTAKSSLDADFPVPKSSTSISRQRPSGRGARLGHAIHKNHGTPWEVMARMQDLGREKSIKSSQSQDALRLEDLVPRPLSPARGDDYGRPLAVDKSIKKMRSFEEARSTSHEFTREVEDPKPKPSSQMSPFPKVIRIQPVKSFTQLQKADISPESLAPQKNVLKKKSTASVRTHYEPLKKRSNRELNAHPIIHVTQPSQERVMPWDDMGAAYTPRKYSSINGEAKQFEAHHQKLYPITLH